MAEEIISNDNDLVARIVAKRMRCENWLQLEIYKRIFRLGSDVQIERPYAGGRERCDCWTRDQSGAEEWVELKVCVTNYLRSKLLDFSNRPITNQIDAVIPDGGKLAGAVGASASGHIVLVAYPLPAYVEIPKDWILHLDRIARHVSRPKHEAALKINVDKGELSIVIYSLDVQNCHCLKSSLDLGHRGGWKATATPPSNGMVSGG